MLEAGKAWNEAHYTWLGTALAKRIATEEVAQVPNFGAVLLPGANGFHNKESYRLNASYLPLQIFLGLGHELPDGPWQQIAAQIPAVVSGSAPQGFASDWVEFKPGKVSRRRWEVTTRFEFIFGWDCSTLQLRSVSPC